MVITVFLLGTSVKAQTSYAKAFEELKSDPVLQNSHLSFHVMEALSGKVLYDWQSEKSMIPASTFKLVTTASALNILGSEFKFKTTLSYSGFLDSLGTLQGNLYLTGEGDPTWGSFRYKTLSQFFDSVVLKEINRLGLKNINGSIIVDVSKFDQNPIPDYYSWTDIGNYYGTGSYALNVHENMYYLDLIPTTLNDSVLISGTRPKLPLVFQNNLTTAPSGTGDNAYIFGSPFDNYRYLSGTIPLGKSIFTIKGALPHPPLYMANYLNDLLQNENIKILNPPVVTYKPINETRNKIYQFSSPSLKEIITQTNHRSINLYAEALLKAIGFKQYNYGTVGNGVKAIKAYWTKKKVNIISANIYDGSGLSPSNNLSANVFTKILSLMYQEDKSNIFYNSLPVASKSGTLANLCLGTAASNNLRAKSGNINNVTAYAGYVKNMAGKMLCFSIIVNNYSCDNSYVISKLDKVMSSLAN